MLSLFVSSKKEEYLGKFSEMITKAHEILRIMMCPINLYIHDVANMSAKHASMAHEPVRVEQW